MSGRAAPQLLIHDCQKLVPRVLVTLAPGRQQSAHIRVDVLSGAHDETYSDGILPDRDHVSKVDAFLTSA